MVQKRSHPESFYWKVTSRWAWIEEKSCRENSEMMTQWPKGVIVCRLAWNFNKAKSDDWNSSHHPKQLRYLSTKNQNLMIDESFCALVIWSAHYTQQQPFGLCTGKPEFIDYSFRSRQQQKISTAENPTHVFSTETGWALWVFPFSTC